MILMVLEYSVMAIIGAIGASIALAIIVTTVKTFAGKEEDEE